MLKNQKYIWQPIPSVRGEYIVQFSRENTVAADTSISAMVTVLSVTTPAVDPHITYEVGSEKTALERELTQYS